MRKIQIFKLVYEVYLEEVKSFLPFRAMCSRYLENLHTEAKQNKSIVTKYVPKASELK